MRADYPLSHKFLGYWWGLGGGVCDVALEGEIRCPLSGDLALRPRALLRGRSTCSLFLPY